MRLTESAEGWFYALHPGQLGTGALARPAEQLAVGPFDTEDQAFEDAKARALQLQRGRSASI